MDEIIFNTGIGVSKKEQQPTIGQQLRRVAKSFEDLTDSCRDELGVSVHKLTTLPPDWPHTGEPFVFTTPITAAMRPLLSGFLATPLEYLGNSVDRLSQANDLTFGLVYPSHLTSETMPPPFTLFIKYARRSVAVEVDSDNTWAVKVRKKPSQKDPNMVIYREEENPGRKQALIEGFTGLFDNANGVLHSKTPEGQLLARLAKNPVFPLK